MALGKCPSCGGACDTSATSCPHCGCTEFIIQRSTGTKTGQCSRCNGRGRIFQRGGTRNPGAGDGNNKEPDTWVPCPHAPFCVNGTVTYEGTENVDLRTGEVVG